MFCSVKFQMHKTKFLTSRAAMKAIVYKQVGGIRPTEKSKPYIFTTPFRMATKVIR